MFALILLCSGCLRDMPENLPDGLVWEGSLAFPIGKDSFGLNVESGVDSVLFELDSVSGFPRWVSRQTIIMEGLSGFSLDDLNQDSDRIKELLLRLNFYNEFPNKIEIQAYFIDPWRFSIDSLFAEGSVVLDAAKVADDGHVIGQTHARQDARINSEKIGALDGVSHILFRAILANPAIDTLLIPYYPDFRFHVHLSAMLDLSAGSR